MASVAEIGWMRTVERAEWVWVRVPRAPKVVGETEDGRRRSALAAEMQAFSTFRK